LLVKARFYARYTKPLRTDVRHGADACRLGVVAELLEEQRRGARGGSGRRAVTGRDESVFECGERLGLRIPALRLMMKLGHEDLQRLQLGGSGRRQLTQPPLDAAEVGQGGRDGGVGSTRPRPSTPAPTAERNPCPNDLKTTVERVPT
jgi:hypothetical protein